MAGYECSSFYIGGCEMILLIVLMLFRLAVVTCHDDGGGAPATTPTYITTGSVRRSPQKVENTPLPDWVVEKVLKIEIGTYSPMVSEFQYINDQFYEVYQGKRYPKNRPWSDKRTKFDEYQNVDRCYDDYMKCSVSQPFPTPVCALFRFGARYGWWSYKSYCEVFFENCRLRQRSWRVVDNGLCWIDRENKDIFKDIYIPEDRSRRSQGDMESFVNNILQLKDAKVKNGPPKSFYLHGLKIKH